MEEQVSPAVTEFLTQLVRLNGTMQQLFATGNVALFTEMNDAIKKMHAVQHGNEDKVLQALDPECVVIYGNFDMIVKILRTTEDGVIDSGSGREFNDSSDATGGDIYLCMGIPGLIDVVDNSSPTALSVFRDKVKNLAYTVVNSNAVQGLCAGAIISYGMSPWAVWLLVADIAIGVLLAAGVVWIVLRARDEKKHPEKYKRKEKI